MQEKLISNWSKRNQDGIYLKQVVQITNVGKNKKGKVIHVSKTKHIPA